jgi:hypothetical protein
LIKLAIQIVRHQQQQNNETVYFCCASYAP